MKDEKEDIDLLLERNAGEQLAKIDWERLRASISARLDGAEQGKASVIRFQRVFKIAVGVAAAAVILIAVIVKTKKPGDFKLEKGQRAVVRFAEAKGSALVEIGRSPAESQVLVDVGTGRSKIAKCDIEIVDVNGDKDRDGTEAAWIIISRPEPAYADNGVSSDVMDFIYLF